MNVEQFLGKLAKEGYYHLGIGLSENGGKETDVLQITININRQVLQNNIDLLARELHMDVEKAAQDASAKYQPRHDRIYLADTSDLFVTEHGIKMTNPNCIARIDNIDGGNVIGTALHNAKPGTSVMINMDNDDLIEEDALAENLVPKWKNI